MGQSFWLGNTYANSCIVTATVHGTTFLLLWDGNSPCSPWEIQCRPPHWQLCGFFKVPYRIYIWKDCGMGPRTLESLTVCKQHFLLSYLQCPGPAWVWTSGLPLERPALIQLSSPGGGAIRKLKLCSIFRANTTAPIAISTYSLLLFCRKKKRKANQTMNT